MHLFCAFFPLPVFKNWKSASPILHSLRKITYNNNNVQQCSERNKQHQNKNRLAVRARGNVFQLASVKVPLRRKFVGLFPTNSVAEYHVVSIFTKKTEQETVHPNIF